MTKIGRNDPCHCGSGKKYKKCCEEKDQQAATSSSVLDFTRRTQTLDDTEDIDDVDPSYDDSDDGELEDLSPDDQFVIKTWWYLYEQMKTPEEIRMHLETIFKHHSHLVEHLGIDQDAMFDLGSKYMKEHRPEEFIAFLMDFRKRFPTAYAHAGAMYDQYIIAWLAAERKSSEVKNYVEQFTDDPGDLEPAAWAINILLAANMSEQALEITGNTNLLADKALDMILYHFLPALKDFTAEGVDEFIANLHHTPLPINNAYVSFWREKLGAMSRPFTPWPDKAPSKKDDMTEILFEPVSQFVRYLHDELNLTWFSAQYYADNTGYYLQTYHEARKKPAPSLFHFPSHDVIETHLENISVDDIGFTDTTRYFTILNGLHYFAAYLNKCGNFSEKEMHTLQSHCVEIYNEHYTEQKEHSYDALFFSKFPVWK